MPSFSRRCSRSAITAALPRPAQRQFWSDVVGFKYKISNLQAAIGCAQLERIDELILRKRRIFQTYRELLSDLPVRHESRAGENEERLLDADHRRRIPRFHFDLKDTCSRNSSSRTSTGVFSSGR